MLHQFCPVVAKKFGVNIAIFLHNMAFWTETNLANEKHLYDGHCWTYNTLKAFQKIFPYFSKQNLETIINSCLRQELIIKGNYNKTKYDRTAWYALTPKAYVLFKQLVNEEYINLLGEAFKAISYFQEIDLLESRNGNPETKKPIPDNKPDNKTYISESDDSLPVIQDNEIVSNAEMINAFRQIFPNHPHPDIKKPDAALVINLNKLRKSWSKEVSGSGKNLTLETFTNYLKNMIDIKHYMTDPDKNYEMVSFITLKTVKSVKAMVEAKQRRSV